MRVHDSDWDGVERLTTNYMEAPDMIAAVARHRTKYM